MEMKSLEKTEPQTIVVAIISAAVSLMPALLQLFSSEKRYEVIFLSGATFLGVVVWFQNRRAMEQLHHMLSEMKEEHERCRVDIAALQAKSSARAGHLNATINNLYRDLVRLAGRRGAGSIVFNEETETYHYEPVVAKAVRKVGERRER